jgi:cytochrome oxidase Cu insertion factor (SCO1/SenC/PrrC family)
MNIRVGVLSLLAIFCLSPASFGEVQTDSQTVVHVGDTAPAFTGEAVENKNISLSDYKGRVVVLDFFATW